jgi:hypothetical protein
MTGTDRTDPGDGDREVMGWLHPEDTPLLDHHLEELLAAIGTASLLMSDEQPADTALGDL